MFHFPTGGKEGQRSLLQVDFSSIIKRLEQRQRVTHTEREWPHLFNKIKARYFEDIAYVLEP